MTGKKRRFKLGRRFAPGEEPEPHRCPATAKVDELTAMLLGLQAGGHQHTDIGGLLDVLDPGHEKREKRDPLADPLTGTTWPGPPGSKPPES